MDLAIAPVPCLNLRFPSGTHLHFFVLIHVCPKERARKMETLTLTQTQEQRFSELMHLSYKKVFNLAYRLAGNRSDAEDLTQEAYFRAYRGFHEYEGDRPFENWIFRIVTRLFLDLVRAKKRRIQPVSYDAPVRFDGDDSLLMQAADPGPNAEEAMMQTTMSERMQCALNSLRPDQRMLVTLADIERVPYSEIADITGVPVGTVRSRLHRAHKRLRAVLDEYDRRGAKGSEFASQPCFGCS